MIRGGVMKRFADELVQLLLKGPRVLSIVITVVTILLIPFTYLLVYLTGGIQYVYSHTMYLAIVLAGFQYGWIGGISVGLLAGVVLGPFMPVDVDTGELQDTFNWVYRVIFFMMIGGLVGYFFDRLRKQTDVIVNLLTTDPQTNIPLFKQMFTQKRFEVKNNDAMILMRIRNRKAIIDSLSTDLYFRALHEMYQQHTTILSVDTKAFLLDGTRFVFIVDRDDLVTALDELRKWPLESLVVDKIPLHIDNVFGVVRQVKADDIFESIDQANEASIAAENYHEDHEYFENIRVTQKPDMLLLGEFTEAIKHKDLRIVMHPIIDIKTNTITSFEVLSRWEHPVFGDISPVVFIPLIINTQLIHLLTQDVIAKTKKMLPVLKKVLPDVTVAINICSRCIYNKENLDYVIDEIADKDIELEITEELLMDNHKATIMSLDKLDKRHIKFNIDDFGTGFSSLRYLSDFKFNNLKIDKSFIMTLAHDKKNQAIVSFVIQLAHSLGKKVIAEGVENKQSLELLIEMDCDYAQGFYFTKPLELEDVVPFIEQFQKNTTTH
jgi:EAL domain-containing protein (putative c-di-GMP-specific phosphodiesterase class I)